MSSGPGALQKQILSSLPKYPAFAYQRQVLWNLSVTRNEIKTTGQICPYIESGAIHKSFQESFRRAVKGLAESGRIILEQKKATTINEAFDYFPYHTSSLEIHQLRKKLLPLIARYIIDESPRCFGHSKIEAELLSRIQDTKKFKKIQLKWKLAEMEIGRNGNFVNFA